MSAVSRKRRGWGALFLGGAAALVGSLSVWALRISPVAFEVTLPTGTSTHFSFQVLNDEEEPLDFEVRLCDWIRDLTGANRFCEEAGEVPRSATAWVEAGPRQFSLHPGEAQEVRLTLTTPEAAPDGSPLEGSYWTAVMVEALPQAEGGSSPAPRWWSSAASGSSLS